MSSGIVTPSTAIRAPAVISSYDAALSLSVWDIASYWAGANQSVTGSARAVATFARPPPSSVIVVGPSMAYTPNTSRSRSSGATVWRATRSPSGRARTTSSSVVGGSTSSTASPAGAVVSHAPARASAATTASLTSIRGGASARAAPPNATSKRTSSPRKSTRPYPVAYQGSGPSRWTASSARTMSAPPAVTLTLACASATNANGENTRRTSNPIEPVAV